MYLTAQQVLDMDQAALEAFLELRISEKLHIDYKRQLTTPLNKEAKREFLKDVTAFANAQGGHIIIGVLEPDDNLAIRDQLVGIDDAEQLAQTLERLTIACIDPKISGLRIVPIALRNSPETRSVFRGCGD